jgi:hypothetical protein
MADANSTLYGLVKPEVGASSDTWGSKLNADLDDTDALLGAFVLTGSSSAYVLTTGLSLAAYATKQRFMVQWNHTNASTSPTLNVDTLGAKNIKKRDGSTNPSASDLVSGRWNQVLYDGTNIVVLDLLPSDFQAYDPGLAALAALSWSSGSPVVQFTAADTVSLTLTPSVTSVTATNATGASTPAGRLANTTDNATVVSLVVAGDRATPANFDAALIGYELSNASGTQVEYVRAGAMAGSATAGAETGWFVIYTRNGGGSLTARAYVDGSGWKPFTSDGMALGGASNMWSDLFLASGAVVNFNNGGVTLTHDATSDGLEVAGGSFRARIALSTETSGTLTAASANKRVKATAGVTINDGVFTAEDSVEIYNDSDVSITITQDTGMTLRLAGSTSTGNRTLAARGIAYVYFDTNADAAVAGSGVS